MNGRGKNGREEKRRKGEERQDKVQEGKGREKKTRKGEEKERRQNERLQQPYPEEDDVTGKYIFDNKFIEETKRTLHRFWKIREKKMKGKEEN